MIEPSYRSGVTRPIGSYIQERISMLYYVYNNDVGTNKDVTSVPLENSGRYLTEVSIDGGSTWFDKATFYSANVDMWRLPFSVRRVDAPVNTEIGLGFSYGNSVHGGFPHPKEGKMYLVLLDFRNAGAALGNIWGRASAFATYLGAASANQVTLHSIPLTANQTSYTRVWGKVSGEAGRFFLSVGTQTSGTTLRFDIKNWRQFDVTGWTDAQIQTLATKENYDEVYATLPSTFKGQSNMTEEKFLEMGGIIRNDNDLDGSMMVHEIGWNYSDI